MKYVLAVITFQVVVGLASAQTILSADVQIKTALLAAAEDSRDKAMVYGYSPKGEFIVLRKGENELVCLADDPAQPGLSVSLQGHHQTERRKSPL